MRVAQTGSLSHGAYRDRTDDLQLAILPKDVVIAKVVDEEGGEAKKVEDIYFTSFVMQ